MFLTEETLTVIERHLTALSSLSAVLSILWFIVKERDVYKRMKLYVNELYYNYCGERQKLYVPVENGADPVIPPLPRNFE